MSDLQLDALSLPSWQACRRQFLLYHDYRVLRRRPKVLFDQCLRKAIVALSAGGDVLTVIEDAKTSLLHEAANPGMDVPQAANAYQIAKDYCAMFETILRAIAKTTLLTLHDPVPVVESAVQWNFLAHADDSGTLHRWITADSWTEDDFIRELHSWRTIGDLIFARVPMKLHVVLIGQQRNGRRASPWARAFTHPRISNFKVRFRKVDGGPLLGWKAYYLADHPDADIDEWVSQMYAEGVAQTLIQHVDVECPTDAVCEAARAQVIREAIAAREAIANRSMIPWHVYPMARNVCDGIVPCPFQPACYSEQVVDPSTLGLYQRRTRYTVSRGTRGA